MQPYYYMVYAIRRMLGTHGEVGDHGEWRAIAFFLLHPGAVVADIRSPSSFPISSAREPQSGGVLASAFRCVIALYWVLGRQQRYARYAAQI